MASTQVLRRASSGRGARGGRGVAALRPARWQLGATAAMHVVNDGLFAGTYPLLPLLAAELGLSYAQVGAVKTAFSGASSVLQVPAGMAAERMGEQLLLALGTGWVGVGLLGMALAGGYLPLLALSVAAGVGGNVQHPVASAVVSRLYDSRRRGSAIATLNFAGDVGKVLAPIIVGLASAWAGWRAGFAALGVIGTVFALLYVLGVPEPHGDEPAVTGADAGPAAAGAGSAAAAGSAPAERVAGWGLREPGAFSVLAGIGILDAMARGAALVFIPFVLQDKGADPASMSFYFAVLFAAGAAGKFICGPLADRFGSVGVIAITEIVTGGALAALLFAPLQLALLALLPLGFMLNGTSSVLYAAVAGFFHTSRRARGYGIFYTATQVASAAAPIIYGALADATTLATSLLTLAAVTAAIAPLAVLTGRSLRAAE